MGFLGVQPAHLRPQDHGYDPRRCSQWVARHLAAEVKRYGLVSNVPLDSAAANASWYLAAGPIKHLLSKWLDHRTEEQRRCLDFQWGTSTDEDLVPSTIEAIQHQVLVDGFLVVSANHCETAIWGEALNIRLRAVHDVDHVLQEFTLSVDDEVRIGCLEAAMFFQFCLTQQVSKQTAAIAAQLLAIDLGGQAFYSAVSGGGFVPDQWAFARECLTKGVLSGAQAYYNEVRGRE